MPHRPFLTRAALAAALLASAPAAAQPPPAGAPPGAPTEAAAQQAPAAALARALAEGAAAQTRGDHAACAAAFARALSLSADPVTAGKLGLCEEALGRPVAAFDHLRLAQEGQPAPAAGGSRGFWRDVADAVARVRLRVVRALLVVDPPDAEVLLDGVSIGRGWSGRYVTVLPGEHTWTARSEGHDDATFTHTPRGGDVPDVHLVLRPRPVAPPAPPCDDACRAAIRADGERAGEARARAGSDVLLRRVRAEVEAVLRGRMDPGMSLIAGGLLSLGLTADPGPGFLVGGELSWGAFDTLAFTLGLEVQTLLPTRIVTRLNGQPADVTQITFALIPCARYKWISGCGFVDAGMLIGGGPPPIYWTPNNLLGTVGLGPRLGFQLPFAERFMVRAFAELRISPITDTGFGFDQAPDGEPTSLWLNPLVSGLIGLSFSFGTPTRYEGQP